MWKSVNTSVIDYMQVYKQYNDNTELWFKRINAFDKNDIPSNGYTYDLYAAFYAGVLTLAIEDNDETQLQFAKDNQNANWRMWTKDTIEGIL